MKRILISLAAISLMATAPMAPAMAQSWGQSFTADEARDARESGEIIPLKRIFRQLKREYGGYQLGAELFTKPSGNGSDYVIDWITDDGRKMRFVVDAQTGRILDASGG